VNGASAVSLGISPIVLYPYVLVVVLERLGIEKSIGILTHVLLRNPNH